MGDLAASHDERRSQRVKLSCKIQNSNYHAQEDVLTVFQLPTYFITSYTLLAYEAILAFSIQNFSILQVVILILDLSKTHR